MGLTQAIYHRRAVRSFTTAPVTAKTLLTLIDAAIQAPSAINGQPWRFTIANRRETLRRIAESSRKYLLSLMQTESPFLRFRSMLEAPECDILYGAPSLVVICATSAVPQAAEDCALAAQNFMLSAYALGFGTCCIGLARPWLNQPDGKRLLGVPTECTPIVPIIVGQPAVVPPATERRVPHIDWIDGPD